MIVAHKDKVNGRNPKELRDMVASENGNEFGQKSKEEVKTNQKFNATCEKFGLMMSELERLWRGIILRRSAKQICMKLPTEEYLLVDSAPLEQAWKPQIWTDCNWPDFEIGGIKQAKIGRETFLP